MHNIIYLYTKTIINKKNLSILEFMHICWFLFAEKKEIRNE